jgi:glycosyltransferase involved in cell wall biosynthesis
MKSQEQLKIAVMLMDVRPSSGGGYQQAINDCRLMQSLSKCNCTLVVVTNVKENIKRVESEGLACSFLKTGIFTKAVLGLRDKIRSTKLLKLLDYVGFQNQLKNHLERQKVDLLHFVTPSIYAMYVEGLPFTYTVWDICHRTHVEFPEIREFNEFRGREDMFRSVLPRSIAVFVDSELSKKQITKFYSTNAERIWVSPFLPAPRANSVVVKTIEDSSKYIFYPAQLWPHKNHVYILKALMVLQEKHGIKMKAVFAGGDRNGLREKLIKKSLELKVEELVEWRGFVSDDEIDFLYSGAFALVMPTYFGPTNLPPLEAFKFGVPVIYSDIPGGKEFLGDAALYVDLLDPSSLADQINSLYFDSKLRDGLIENGKIRLARVMNYDRKEIWEKVLSNFLIKALTWK